MKRAALGCLALLSGCAPAAPTADTPPRAATASTSSSAALASASASSQPVLAAPDAPIPTLRFVRVLDKTIAGNNEPDAITMSYLPLAEGLLVVVNMPAAAFLVKGDKAEPLPHFFDGLRSPCPDWPADAFSVESLQGDLNHLSFDLIAPSSGYQDSASGKPGHFRTTSGKKTGAIPKQAEWIDPATISIPFTTKKGARIYSAAPDYQAPASAGFRFLFDGPSKGEKLPVPTPGKNGCKYAMLGHPLLTQNSDGSLMGLGTLCENGDQSISTAKLNGVEPPFQSLGPRLGVGALAVERWIDGKGTILTLPGAERMAEFASFDFVRVPRGADHLYVVSQVSGEKKNHAYVAEYDGTAFRDVTPPDAPEYAHVTVSSTDELYLFAPSKSFRRKPGGWEPITMQHRGECGAGDLYTAYEAPSGDIFLNALSCTWSLKKGAAIATLVAIEGSPMIQDMFTFQGQTYFILWGKDGWELMRLVP